MQLPVTENRASPISHQIKWGKPHTAYQSFTRLSSGDEQPHKPAGTQQRSKSDVTFAALLWKCKNKDGGIYGRDLYLRVRDRQQGSTQRLVTTGDQRNVYFTVFRNGPDIDSSNEAHSADNFLHLRSWTVPIVISDLSYYFRGLCQELLFHI